jgi:DNA repair exonuclease SbcCD ATPase subunit
MATRSVWLMLGLAVAAGAPLQPLHASKIVCWTDQQGRRACGDRVPPQYAKQERQVYDEAGRLIETLPRQKTFEEAEDEQRRAAELEARRKRAQEQAAYDRFLLTTFTSVAELEKTRDTRLATLDGRLGLAEESLEQNEKGIEQLKAQIADAEVEGRKVPGRLARQLQEFEQNLESNRLAVAKLREERETIRSKFHDDIDRYRALTGKAEPPLPTSVPASAAEAGG